MSLFGKIVDPMMGVTVIRFITHGCMGQIHEFNYIGVIIDVVFKGKHKFYKIRVEKSLKGERRDGLDEYEEVASWYLQKMNGFYISYD